MFGTGPQSGMASMMASMLGINAADLGNAVTVIQTSLIEGAKSLKKIERQNDAIMKHLGLELEPDDGNNGDSGTRPLIGGPGT